MQTIITIIESVYLLYMFFIYKTENNYSYALFDKQIQDFILFNHSNGPKICIFGKIMALCAVFLFWLRLYIITYRPEYDIIIKYIIVFDAICIFLSLLLNLNAFIYIIPLILTEIYLFLNR